MPGQERFEWQYLVQDECRRDLPRCVVEVIGGVIGGVTYVGFREKNRTLYGNDLLIPFLGSGISRD